ncbi:MAG: AraC family transcriptional regulator [Eubacteriales bacterium]
MDAVKPIKLTRAKYFDKDMFFDLSTHEVCGDYPLHWHDFYEIEYIHRGHAVQVINGVEYEVESGSVALLSPTDFHSYKNVSPDDPLYVFNIKFSDLILPAELRTELCTLSRPLFGMTQRLKPLFDSLYNEYNNDWYGREQYILAGVAQLCILLLRSAREYGRGYGRLTEGAESSSRSLVQEAVLYIRTHYRKPITVEEVAKVVHLTPNYFSEYFKKQTGVKFSSYVQKLRLEFAVSLLKMSDLSVKQVADEAGFNSAAYFSNAFKDTFGISPEQFRKSDLRTISPVQSIVKEMQ